MSPTKLYWIVSRRAKRRTWLLFFVSSLSLAIPRLIGCTPAGGGGSEASIRAARLVAGDGGAAVDSGDAQALGETPAQTDQKRLAPDEVHELTRKLLSSEGVEGWENLSEAGFDQVNQIWTKNPPTDKHQTPQSLKDQNSLALAQEAELQTNEAYLEFATTIAKGSLSAEERGELKALLIEGAADGAAKDQVEP